MSQLDPRYEQAQRSVLGSLMLDAPHVAGMVLHRTQTEDYTGEYRSIFQACRELFQEGRPIDPVTVLNAAGREYYGLIQQLMLDTPTAANVEAYIEQTVEQAKLARLQGMSLALAGCRDLEEAQRLVAQAGRILGGRPGVRVVTMEQGFQDFYARQNRPARLITWGLDKVDDTLRAEWGGDFIVLGGYPSAGKTALSLQLAWNQAKDHRVGYFSLETKPEKLVDRMVAAVCGVDFGRIKEHRLRPEDWDACEYRAQAFVGRKLEVIQAGGLSVVDIQALTLAGRYEIIYIDYLQLIAAEDRRRSDVDQVTQISKDLHTMAQTTGVTVCALSQLSRPPKSGQQEPSPGLHSLRQSGQIEQDADGVLLLYKEEPKNPRSRRVLKIAKNKDGEAGGIVYLILDGARQRFRISLTDAVRPKREPEYKQTAMYDLPGSVRVPFEEEGERDKGQAAVPAGGGSAAPPGAGQPVPGTGSPASGGGPGPGDGPLPPLDEKDLPF